MSQELIASMLDPDRPTSDELTAYHEAGHGVAAVALGIVFNHVSIVGDPDNRGFLAFDHEPSLLHAGFDPGNPEDRRAAEDRIVMAFAGEAAAADRAGRPFNIHGPEAEGDFQLALGIAHRLHVDRAGLATLFLEVCSRACRFVREPLRAGQISLVAQHLRLARELGRDQVVALMRETASADWSESR